MNKTKILKTVHVDPKFLKKVLSNEQKTMKNPFFYNKNLQRLEVTWTIWYANLNSILEFKNSDCNSSLKYLSSNTCLFFFFFFFFFFHNMLNTREANYVIVFVQQTTQVPRLNQESFKLTIWKSHRIFLTQ
jgi:hypothetical protein